MESIKDGRTGTRDARSQKHVLPALWMDSSPWNGHSLRAPTRAMDPPRIIFMDSTKPCGGEKHCHGGGPTNFLLPPVQTVHRHSEGLPFLLTCILK